jgi:hypothetical protein
MGIANLKRREKQENTERLIEGAKAGMSMAAMCEL